MKITLAITTFNCLNYTKLCLHSLLETTKLEDIQVLIVDNCSTDGTQEWVKNFCSNRSNFVLLALDKNYGCSKAFNEALKVSDSLNSDLCILSNNDVVYTPKWIEQLLEFYDSYPEAGLFSPMPIDNHVSDDAKYSWFGDLKDSNYVPKIDPQWNLYAHGVRDQEKAFVDEGINANTFVITRDCRAAVGDFDENFEIGCYDDIDYCVRAEHAGFKCYTTRNSIVFHFGGSSQAAYRLEHGHNSYQQRNKMYFQQKWNVNLDAIGARCTRSCFWSPNKQGINERIYI